MIAFQVPLLETECVSSSDITLSLLDQSTKAFLSQYGSLSLSLSCSLSIVNNFTNTARFGILSKIVFFLNVALCRCTGVSGVSKDCGAFVFRISAVREQFIPRLTSVLTFKDKTEWNLWTCRRKVIECCVLSRS